MSIFQYLLQVNICLILFYAFYTLLLRNETFFRLNRIYLVSTALLSFVLPLLQSAWIRSLFVTEKVYQAKEAISYVLYSDALVTNVSAAEPAGSPLSLFAILSGLYLLGCISLSVRFLYQLYLLKRTSAGHGMESKAYSFFNKIVVAPDVEERSTIHKHEEVHVQEWHSADVLMFEIVAIINWFNPVVYAYKKSVKSIHEYIADEKASSLQPTKEAYAMLLMSNVFGVQANQLTNSFYKPSLLKRRIVMLYKTKSRKIAVLKYGFSAPVFVLMLILSSATIKADKIEAYGEEISDIKIAYPYTDSPAEETKKSQAEFLKLHPSIKQLSLSGLPNYLSIYLKNGKVERYNLKNKAEVAKAVAKYGYLPLLTSPKKVSTIKFPPLIKVPKDKLQQALADTSKKPLFLIDGKVASEKLVKALSPASIESVTVNKSDDLVAKYGPDAKWGVLDIKLKDLADATTLQEVIVVGYPSAANGVRTRSTETIKNAPTDALVIIDGQAQSGDWKTISSKISPEEITAVTVLKDASSTAAYGDKGKNGVLIINTKAGKLSARPHTPSNTDAIKVANDDNIVFTSVEVLPRPADGYTAWNKFLSEYKYPKEAIKNGTKGKLVLTFIVEKDGSLSNIKVVRDLGYGTGKAALELLSRAPKWTPGIQNGWPVRVAYTLPMMIDSEKK